MRDFAKSFYASKAWKKVREYVFLRDMKLCVRCGKPGEIVHHKEHLTPENISDPLVSLNEHNLETLCRECHAIEHEGEPVTERGLVFDEDGDIAPNDASIYDTPHIERDPESLTHSGLVFDEDGNLVERSELS